RGLSRKTSNDSGGPAALERFAVDERRERPPRPDHGGNPELTRDDRGVRERASDFGNDGGSACEQWAPRNVRGLAHQHVASFELSKVRLVADEPRGSSPDSPGGGDSPQHAGGVRLRLPV